MSAPLDGDHVVVFRQPQVVRDAVLELLERPGPGERR